MGLVLLIILSALFGYAFTETANRKTEKVQSQLDETKAELERIKEAHEFEKKIWQNTVRELLNGK